MFILFSPAKLQHSHLLYFIIYKQYFALCYMHNDKAKNKRWDFLNFVKSTCLYARTQKSFCIFAS